MVSVATAREAMGVTGGSFCAVSGENATTKAAAAGTVRFIAHLSWNQSVGFGLDVKHNLNRRQPH